MELGLEDRLRHRPAELSVGERQRVALARALLPSLGRSSSISGGRESTTSDGFSPVSGGLTNTAEGAESAVSGGWSRTVVSSYDWRVGSLFEDD